MGDSVLILGGAGLVGMQVARLIRREVRPDRLVIASLFAEEAEAAVRDLLAEFPDQGGEVVAESGNIFLREAFRNTSKRELLSDEEKVWRLYRDVFERLDASDPDNILNQSLLVRMIRNHRPTIIIDCINSATAISYVDIRTSSEIVRRYGQDLEAAFEGLDDGLLGRAKAGDEEAGAALADWAADVREAASYRPVDAPGITNQRSLAAHLISQMVPQLLRHVILLYRACNEVGTQQYIKVGTTGTGGMGINIPYTHGEDKPSFKLLSKASIGFAHTGLLFLLDRTPGPTIFKEIKPGAMIGYKKVEFKAIQQRGGPIPRVQARTEVLDESLRTKETFDVYETGEPIAMPGVDTGENGFFSRGEYEAITYLNQMEFVTPEEIAALILRELQGRNTGRDVISALDGAILNPSYRAGFLRQSAIDKLEDLEEETGVPSVAIGQLGPPQLTKLLYEAYLLQRYDPDLRSYADDADFSEGGCSRALVERLENDPIRDVIVSIGVPILLPDGERILRGPKINIPEIVGAEASIDDPEDVDTWAKRGWIDLRLENIRLWRSRFQKMLSSRDRFVKEGSAAFDITSYPYDEIRIGEVVGWIFNNELIDGNMPGCRVL